MAATSNSIKLRFVNLTHGSPRAELFESSELNSLGLENLAFGEATAYHMVSANGFSSELKKSSHIHYTIFFTDVVQYGSFLTLDWTDEEIVPGYASLRIIDESSMANFPIFPYYAYQQFGERPIQMENQEAFISTFIRADTFTTIVKPVEGSPIVLTDLDYGHEFHQPNFNPELYVGTWHQIADIPQYFEAACLRTQAQYTLLSDKIKVTNVCFDDRGEEIRRVTGQAEVADKRYPAGLIVSFGQDQPIPGVPVMPKPTFPNYIVHATDYVTYTLIGSSDRSNLYILSRNSTMSVSLYRQLVDRAAQLGYDVGSLVRAGALIAESGATTA